jgi:ketosteroid isomerase-like protein
MEREMPHGRKSLTGREEAMPGDPKADALTKSTVTAVNRFNEAFNRHDVDAVMAAMTKDCVFENTWPAPDGERYEGREAVRSFWEKFFRSSPNSVFKAEEIFAGGDRCVVRWRYDWVGKDGKPGHVRGVDVVRVRDGKVAEKLSYVKG